MSFDHRAPETRPADTNRLPADATSGSIRVAAGLLAVALLALGSTVVRVEASGEAKKDEATIRKLVESSYFNGAFNGLDTEAMARGFHEDFAIFSAKGNDLARYEIATWISGIESRKQSADFDASASAFEGKIVEVDVTGGAASAKIELRKEGKLVYTDYLSFLRFEDGWKIAAKVYHRHE